MFYHRKPSWHIPEVQATAETAFLNRRQWLAAMGIGGAASALLSRRALAAQPGEDFDPAPERNSLYKIGEGREMTDEKVASSYNNFYEFGSHKQIAQKAQALDTDGWTVKIDGKVEKEMVVDAEDLIAKMPLEERVTRHRCVEAWSMVVPWVCFPLAELVKIANPASDAKYVQFETFLDPETASGQRQSWYPWAYTEGLTIEEATNPVAIMVVGAYGKVLPKQFGAPMRLHVPWKYGFKSAKSISRITFTEKRPVSFWEEINKAEYGFWANVNPEVDHPRWTQATERVIGTEERIPTLKFNGYGEEVAGLYSDTLAKKEGVRLWR
jgi:sulfoxide reductase catalytic subunit YedY